MQTVGRAASRTVGPAHNPRDGKRTPPQRRTKEKGARSQRRHYGFLTERIAPIGAKSVERSDGEENMVNLVSRDNYRRLRASALNYARLLGKDLGHVPAGNTGACIADLYHKLAELEPSLNLNMESANGRLHFIFWKPCDYNGHSLYWIEIKFLETLSPPMRKAATLFFRRLRKRTGMLTTNQSPDVDWLLECLDEQYEQGEWLDEKERRANRAVIDSYKDGGKVYKLMQEIEQSPDPDADLAGMLSEVKPRKAKERNLLEILREGLRFTDSASPSIFNYEYDPGYDETNDEHGIELGKMVRFMYEQDLVNDDLIQSLNHELECGNGECVPCTRLCLTPDTGSVFAEDPFPSEFFAWMVKLIECVNYDD